MAVRSGRELEGLAVVTLAGGARIGRVEDVVFYGATGRVTGFRVDTGGLLSHPRFLPAGQVRGAGADALTVADAEALQAGDPAGEDPGAVTARSLIGRPVLTDAGTVVGKVADVLVDTETLTVLALSLSTGVLDNALHGKPSLPVNLIQTFGPDSVVVPASYDPHAASSHAPVG